MGRQRSPAAHNATGLVQRQADSGRASLPAGSACAQPSDKGVHVQAAFHAISTGQDMPPHSGFGSERHAQKARARPEEAPVVHVYGIQGACIAIGTVLFGVVVWWWNSGVSDGTKHYDMTRMAKEERCCALGVCCRAALCGSSVRCCSRIDCAVHVHCAISPCLLC